MHFGPRHHPAAAGAWHPRPRHGRLAASQTRVCSRVDLLRTAARTLVRPSAAFPRQGLAAPRAGACQPIPRYARPLPAPKRSSRPGNMCEHRSDRSELPRAKSFVPRASLSAAAGAWANPRPARRRCRKDGSLAEPMLPDPTRIHAQGRGSIGAVRIALAWPGSRGARRPSRRKRVAVLRADFRPHPVQPLLKTANCPFRPRRNAFRRRLLPVDGASALG